MQHYNNYYLYRGSYQNWIIMFMNTLLYMSFTCLVVRLKLESELDLFSKQTNIKHVIFLIELELFDWFIAQPFLNHRLLWDLTA